MFTEVQAGISDLFARLGVAFDIDTDAAMRYAWDAFREDGTFVIEAPGGARNGPFEGRQAVYDLMVSLKKSERDDGRRGRHVMTNLLVSNIGDDAADAMTYMTYVVTKDNEISIVAVGHYQARVVRVGGVWYFERLHLYLDNVPPAVAAAAKHEQIVERA